MRPTLLDDIRRQVHGRWLKSPPREPIRITKVAIDSRKVAAGDLFVALPGGNFDGHDFLAQVAAAGCPAAIVQKDKAAAAANMTGFGGLIVVPDTIVALGELAKMHRRNLTGQVIAVTGSVGKTTVKGMIHHILSASKKGSAALKSFNNNIGVPLTLLAAEEGDDYVVCELGSNAPGEIATLTKIAEPDLAIITAVGPSHLERLGSVQRVAVEKASILGSLEKSRGVGIIWADSEPLEQAVRPYDVRLIRFGQSDKAELRLTAWESMGAQQRFQVNGRAWFTLPLAGKHNALNALAAMAAAMRFGLSLEQAGAPLADVAAGDMRLQIRRAGDVIVINDAYNANPMSMGAAVDVLGSLEGSRRVLVAGDMRELGEQSPQLHLELGRKVGQSNIDVLVAVGALAAYIARGAKETNGTHLKIMEYPAARDAAAHVDEWLKGGDTVLVKASRSVGAECIVDGVIAHCGARGSTALEGNAK